MPTIDVSSIPVAPAPLPIASSPPTVTTQPPESEAYIPTPESQPNPVDNNLEAAEVTMDDNVFQGTRVDIVI